MKIPRTVLVLLVLLLARGATACPLCKVSVRETSAALAVSYNQSTFVILGSLFTLLAFLAVIFRRAVRDAGRRQEAMARRLAATGADTPGPLAPSGEPPARSR